jgi:hypothetical protein
MPEKMKVRSIKMVEADWVTLQTIAKREGKSVNQLINELCKGYVIQHGGKWQGGQKRGRPGRQRVVRP